MIEALNRAMRSRTGRAAGVAVAALLLTFLAGYILLGPIAMRLLPR